MRFSVLVASALVAVASSAPTLISTAQSVDKDLLSEYFNLLASKVQTGKSNPAPVCNMANAVLPTIPGASNLPPPSIGLQLKHVAVGRGTQNYTCGTDPTAAPVLYGALATLYNASCVAATYPDVLSSIPAVALQFNLSASGSTSNVLAPSDLQISGHHFFENPTTPTFNMDTNAQQIGFATCAKNNTVPAPTGAPVGQNNKGYGSVAWLKLLTTSATGGLKEVYRVNTAGGNAPPTCAGMPATFEVQYSAEYWFFETAP